MLIVSPFFTGMLHDVRLVGGQGEYEGRVELFHKDEWGTVCHDYWNIYDGHVVCRQMGYLGAVTTYSSAHFGRGSGIIWLDNLRCTGSESTLFDCPHNGAGSHDCSHYSDAGVTCKQSILLFISTTLGKFICTLYTCSAVTSD